MALFVTRTIISTIAAKTAAPRVVNSWNFSDECRKEQVKRPTAYFIGCNNTSYVFHWGALYSEQENI
jgi:hypothetical protein